MRSATLLVVSLLSVGCGAPRSLPADTNENVTLIRLAGPRVVDWDASAIGRLVVRDGCLRLDTGGEDYTVVWPQDARLVGEGDRLIVVSGQWRATVGETVAMAGGETPALSPDVFDAPVTPADTSCPPRFWVTHRFQAGGVAP